MTRRIALLLSAALIGLLLGARPISASVSPAAGEPRVSMRLSSSAVRQGDVLIVRVTTVDPSQVAGLFGDQELRFALEEEAAEAGSSRYISLLGIDALHDTGSFPILITATAQSGAVDQTAGQAIVRAGRFVRESVTLTRTLMPLLDPALNDEEELAMKTIYAAFSPLKWWDAPLLTPVKGRLVSVYGNRRTYNGINLGTYHSGYDYAAGKGTPVLAAAPGRVAAVRQMAIRGNMVVVDHGRGVFTSYFHLSEIDVSEGQMVDMGNPLGKVGTTGRSQGNHLHFELAVGGSPVDPGYWFEVALP
jgi:murein DD-endopeptidase MepM/ murein hydrolase activator NlpD